MVVTRNIQMYEMMRGTIFYGFNLSKKKFLKTNCIKFSRTHILTLS